MQIWIHSGDEDYTVWEILMDIFILFSYHENVSPFDSLVTAVKQPVAMLKHLEKGSASFQKWPPWPHLCLHLWPQLILGKKTYSYCVWALPAQKIDDRKVTELILLNVHIPCFFLPKTGLKHCVLCVHSWRRLLMVTAQIIYLIITGLWRKTWDAVNTTACELWLNPGNTSPHVSLKKDNAFSSSVKPVRSVFWSRMKR